MKKIFLILITLLLMSLQVHAGSHNSSALDKQVSENEQILVVTLQKVLAKQDYTEALKIADKALQYDSEWGAMYNNRALIYKNLGKYDLAMLDFDRAINLDPNYEKAIYGRANLKMLMNDDKGALKDFNVLIKNNPKDADVYNSRGILYLNQKKAAKAIKEFNKAISLNDKKWIFYGNRGTAKMFSEEYEAAIADYSKALDLNPENPELYYKRALCLNHFPERKKECISDFKKSAKLYSKYGNKVRCKEIKRIINSN